MRGGATGVPPSVPPWWLVVGWLLGRGRRICVSLLRELVSGFCSSLLASVGVGWMWSMACVQGTWWGVGGGVVGGWVGSWFRGVVSGGGWVSGWGCLVGGRVCWVGPGAWWVGGVTCGGLFPLDPSLTPAPTCLVGCGSWFGSSLCWVVQAVGWWVSSGRSSFLMGWAGLVGGLSCGLCPGWVVLNLGSWLRFSLAVEVWSSVCWGCSLVGGSVGCALCRGVVLLLAVSFPLGGPTWTVGLFLAPLFLPPRYTTAGLRPPIPVGKLTR